MATQRLISTTAILTVLGLLSPVSALAVTRGTTPARPRNLLTGRQTTAFVNFFSKPGCHDDDFVVALATNNGPIASPDNCVAHNSLDFFADLQQDDGSFPVFMKPTTEAIFGGDGAAILRTPVEIVDEDFCGTSSQVMDETDNCYDTSLGNDFMLQSCPDSQNCVVKPSFGRRQDGPDKSCFTETSRKTVVFTSESQIAEPGITCTGKDSCPQEVSFTASYTLGFTAEFSAGIEGLFSATFGVSYEESKSKSAASTFPVPPGSQGNIIWTPIRTCVTGNTRSCGFSIEDQDGVEMCNVETVGNDQPSGQYSFQSTG